MRIKDFLFAIKKRWWLVLLAPLLVTSYTTYYNYKNIPDMYRSQVTFIVAKDKESANGVATTQGDLSLWQNLVGDYTEILTSSKCLSLTSKALDGVPINSGMITVDSNSYSRVIYVTVTNTDPQLAADIANELIVQFESLVDEKLNMKYVTVIDEAMPAGAPFYPNRKQNITMSFVASLIAALGLSLLLEFIDSSLKTNEDIEKHLGLPVLARIPRYY